MRDVAVIVEKRFHIVLFIILVLLTEFEVFRFFFVQKNVCLFETIQIKIMMVTEHSLRETDQS